MRFCGSFVRLQNLARTENRPQAHRVARQSIGSALLAVDDTDGRTHRQTGRAERRNGLQQRPSGRDDVLDQAHAVALVVRAFDPVRGAVFLRRLADDQERQAGCERPRGRKRDRPELGARQPRSVRLEFPDRLRDAVAGRVSKRYLSR
jgi:hypothetical protein